jgi:hypothetical protein
MAHKVDIDSATRHVEAHADAAGRTRLRFAFFGECAPAEVLCEIFAAQCSDGGFSPSWASEASSVDATCQSLALLEQLGGLAHPDKRIMRAVNFLALRQAADGSLEEHVALAELAPPWAAPGDPAAQLYLTANAGFWLAILDSLPETANAAGRFLHNQLQKGDALASFMQANWLAAGLWHRLGWMKPFDYACAYLLRHVESLDTGKLGWLGVTLLIAGVPTASPLLQATARRLVALQGSDGCWRSADGPQGDVQVTIDALRVITRCQA